MKILYYSPHPDLSLHSPSGYGTHMREMIKAFEEAGHEVRPLIVGDLKVAEAEAAPRLRDRVKPLVPALVWESARDAALLHRDRRLQITLEDNIQAFGPNLIYERASFMQCSGVEVAWRLGVRHVLEVNAPYLEERKAFSSGPSLFERKARAMERRQLSMTDRAVVVSSTLKDHFMAAHGLPEERFLVVPNAVDPDKIVVHPDRVHAIKTGYGLTDQFVVGFVGSLFRWHGVDRLIRAAVDEHPPTSSGAKQLKITPALREYVQQKMGKTQKYFDHIVWGQAFLFVEKRSHKAIATSLNIGETTASHPFPSPCVNSSFDAA